MHLLAGRCYTVPHPVTRDYHANDCLHRVSRRHAWLDRADWTADTGLAVTLATTLLHFQPEITQEIVGVAGIPGKTRLVARTLYCSSSRVSAGN